ncbi:MAG: hypothetical protein ACRCZS_15915 [Chroococcidiopsis sp.]
MTDEELTRLVESVAKTALANSNLIAESQRQQADTLRRIEDLRADVRELVIENQRILRYLEFQSGRATGETGN